MTEPTSRPEGAVHRTVDLSEAAFLAARGHLASVVARTQYQAEFHFDATPELAASLQQYASGQHSVDVLTYDAMRTALRKKAAIACAALRGRPA